MSLSMVLGEISTNLRSLILYSPSMDIIIDIEDVENLNQPEIFFGEIDISEMIDTQPDVQLDHFVNMDILINSNNLMDTETEINSHIAEETETSINSNNAWNMETLHNFLNETNFTGLDWSFINFMNLLFYRYILENNEDEENIYLQYELSEATVDLLRFLQSIPQTRPVPENVINNLPVIKMDVNQLQKFEQCPICLENFKLEEKVILLPCNHSYHECCVKLWFERQNHCPVCRQEI